jgi:serine/threonine protein kinase
MTTNIISKANMEITCNKEHISSINPNLNSNNSIISTNDTSNTSITNIRNGKDRSYSESHISTRIPMNFPISSFSKCMKGKYEYKNTPIGRGMFSTVYYATDYSGNEFAVKRISVDKLDETRLDKFLLELEISYKLHHINIVHCYEVCRTQSHWYIVSEYCSNGTFKDLIKRVKSLDKLEKEITCRYYLYQLRDAIQYLHENKIIHRDLKPLNILMTKNKGASSEVIVKLADFGFSRFFDVTEATMTTGYDDMVSTICGSPIYMAPELLIKMKYNMKADIWSFGVIMYELLHGRNPYFYPKSIPELQELMKKEKIVYGDYSPECIDLLQKILQIDPENRISWDDFFNHPWFNSTTIDLYHQMDSLEDTSYPEEQQIFQFDEEMDDQCKNNKKSIPTISQSVPVFKNHHSHKNRPIKLTQKKSEDDFIIVQKDDNTITAISNGDQQIKIYSETYTSSIIKILANSIVYMFKGDKGNDQQSRSL